MIIPAPTVRLVDSSIRIIVPKRQRQTRYRTVWMTGSM
jgi:hypothetical protein